MKDDLLINIDVAGRKYRINTRRGGDDEENIRKAAKLIRDVMAEFKKSHPSSSEFPVSEQDYLACAAIQIVWKYVSLLKQNEEETGNLLRKIGDALGSQI